MANFKFQGNVTEHKVEKDVNNKISWISLSQLKTHWYPLSLIIIDIINITFSLHAPQFNFRIDNRNTDFFPSHPLYHPDIDFQNP